MSETLLEKSFDDDGVSLATDVQGRHPVSISGLTAAGAGTVSLQRSTDGGTVWGTVKLPSFADADFTADAEFDIQEDAKVKYRFSMADYTSGTIACRIGYKGA